MVQQYSNLAICRYGISRFEVQGDVPAFDDVDVSIARRTVKVAVFDTLAEAEAFVSETQAEAA